MSNQASKEATASVGVGGWSSFGPVTPSDLKIFNEAVGEDHIIGKVKYTPETVATQLVAGMNYKFMCKAQPASKVVPLQWQAIVEIFVPLDGKYPHVVGVTSIPMS